MRSLTLRYSELATLADCQLKYKLAYAEAMVSGSSPRLVLGTAYHALMEGHYGSLRLDDLAGRRRDLGRARAAAGAKLNEWIRNNRGVDGQGDAKHVTSEVLDQLRWMYTGYTERWSTDEDWDKILVIEERRVVPLVSHLGVRVQLAVTADLVVHHRAYDRNLLIDHKTLSGRDAGKAATQKENWLDPQRGLYCASYTLKGPKKGRVPIFGAYHNTVRTDQLKRDMVTEERFGRGVVYFNNTELEQCWTEAQNLARDAVEIRLGRGRAKRMYSSPNPQECGWKCSFKEVHLTARATGRDPGQVALDFGFTRADVSTSEFIGELVES